MYYQLVNEKITVIIPISLCMGCNAFYLDEK